MRTILIFLIITLSGIVAYSQVKVRGYYRSNGTYVQPHYRSSPDGNPTNNYSYPGNTNPYTGKIAKGKQSTYLANYYKTYPNGTEQKFNVYTTLLRNTNYRGLVAGKSYSIGKNNEPKTGNVQHLKDRTFGIYDADWKHIGYVKINRNGRIFKVYDLYDHKVFSNRERINLSGLEMVGLVGLGIFLGTYLFE